MAVKKRGETPSPSDSDATCPHCGGQEFTVAQYTYNTQVYNAASGDWSNSEWFDYQGGDLQIGVRCANGDCDHLLTKLFVEKGWLDLVHDYDLKRRVASAIALPQTRVLGRNGMSRRGRVVPTVSGQMANIAIFLTDKARFPDLAIDGPVVDLLALLEQIISDMLTQREAYRDDADLSPISEAHRG